MKSFFRDMNLARGIILFAVVGSIALGAVGWKQQQKLNDLKENLTDDTPKLVKDLMRLGHQHTQLKRAAGKEGLSGGQADFNTYIRNAANKDGVDLGEVKLNGSPQERGKGVVDLTETIVPADRERRYERYKIANFLYALERDSHRVKVTRIKMNVAEKNVKPHEIPDDTWTFEAAVTSRQRTEEKPTK
jgi:2',3'-cyclic-nucleotide 2'-phosphodiesterase (5'-nucleotidase family)